MFDPLLVVIVIVILIVSVPIALAIRDGVYEGNSDKMFDARELLIRHAEKTAPIDFIDLLNEVDAGMQGYALVKVAPFVQYHKSDSIPWRYVEEYLQYGVAFAYRALDASGHGIDRQVSIYLDTEDVAALWPHHMDDDADKRRLRIDAYTSLLERFLGAHPTYGNVMVVEPFITSGAKSYFDD